MVNKSLKTNAGTLISTCYERIVCGGRGDYIEIAPEYIIRESIFLPDHAKWRIEDKYKDRVYFEEYRTKDRSFVKLYYQRRLVDYADYKIGFWYVSPRHLVIEDVGN